MAFTEGPESYGGYGAYEGEGGYTGPDSPAASGFQGGGKGGVNGSDSRKTTTTHLMAGTDAGDPSPIGITPGNILDPSEAQKLTSNLERIEAEQSALAVNRLRTDAQKGYIGKAKSAILQAMGEEVDTEQDPLRKSWGYWDQAFGFVAPTGTRAADYGVAGSVTKTGRYDREGKEIYAGTPGVDDPHRSKTASDYFRETSAIFGIASGGPIGMIKGAYDISQAARIAQAKAIPGTPDTYRDPTKASTYGVSNPITDEMGIGQDRQILPKKKATTTPTLAQNRTDLGIAPPGDTSTSVSRGLSRRDRRGIRSRLSGGYGLGY